MTLCFILDSWESNFCVIIIIKSILWSSIFNPLFTAPCYNFCNSCYNRWILHTAWGVAAYPRWISVLFVTTQRAILISNSRKSKFWTFMLIYGDSADSIDKQREREREKMRWRPFPNKWYLAVWLWILPANPSFFFSWQFSAKPPWQIRDLAAGIGLERLQSISPQKLHLYPYWTIWAFAV